MVYRIENKLLRVCADTHGAQLMSILGADGTEYLWQGNPAYWKGRAPNIFPYVGRLTGGRFTYRGESFSLPVHGFAPTSEFALESRSGGSMVFRLESDERTREMYPFHFVYFISYSLDGCVLRIENRVENRGGETMYFGLGGHPGINVPLASGERFEDYFLELPPCSPRRVELTDDCFVTGRDEPFETENGRIELRHELFDRDAIILRGVSGPVTLRGGLCGHGVTLSAPDFPLLGFWQPKTDAPFICLEPWSSLPSRSGVVEELENQPDLTALPSGETYRAGWSLEIF